MDFVRMSGNAAPSGLVNDHSLQNWQLSDSQDLFSDGWFGGNAVWAPVNTFCILSAGKVNDNWALFSLFELLEESFMLGELLDVCHIFL